MAHAKRILDQTIRQIYGLQHDLSIAQLRQVFVNELECILGNIFRRGMLKFPDLGGRWDEHI